MKKNGPWTIKRSEVKYKSPWMEVREDQVIRPDGKDGIYGTVSFGPGGSQVLPLDSEGNVYLIKEFAYAREIVEITIVAGGLENDETPLDAAQRELLEEAGIKAKKWTYLDFANPLTSYTQQKNHMFLAEDLTFVERIGDPSEIIDLYKVALSEAVDMVMDGRIAAENAGLLILKVQPVI